MSTPLLASRACLFAFVLWPSATGSIREIHAGDASPGVELASFGGRSGRIVARNMELSISGSWPTAKFIDVKLMGTGAGFVLSLPDPLIDVEAVLTELDADFLLDYNLTLGDSELSGSVRIPAEDLGKPLTVAQIYSYQISLTLTKR